MNINDKNNDKKQKDLDKPDPETLRTSDLQEHMEGPISSLVQDVKKAGENKEEIKNGKKK
jgi:hypothetical protein